MLLNKESINNNNNLSVAYILQMICTLSIYTLGCENIGNKIIHKESTRKLEKLIERLV